MEAIQFLYKHILKNRVKMAVRKPITYLYIALFLLYAFMLPYAFTTIFERFSMDSPAGMTALMTVFAFWMIPGNLIAYAKRKGLLYRKSDVHFLFPAPVSPKKILLYAHLRNLILQTVLTVVLGVAGGIIFHVAWWRIALYFLFALVIENVLEGSIMLIYYGSERMTETVRKLTVKAAYGLVLVICAIAAYFYVTQGLSLESVMNFLHSEMVQFVPVVGWHIAVLHLIFMEPSVVNLFGTFAYLLVLAAAFAAAVRMRCTGAFYEEAIKFSEDYEEVLEKQRQGETAVRLGKKKKFGKASVSYKGNGAKAIFYRQLLDEDYEEVLEKQRQGETAVRLGKKKKFGKASVSYKGNGAKAIFYRQLLEYKKNRFFIFDANTAAAAIAGVLAAWFYVKEENMGMLADFLIPGAAAYVIFIFTALSSKWSKEIMSPYTYLIPDTAFRKLWYATAMQHIAAVVNGILITVPGAVVMKMSPFTAVLCVIFYVALSANKLYALAVAEALVGNLMGRTGKQLFQLFLQGIVIGVAFLGAFLGMLVGGINLAYVMMILFLAAATALFMLAATLNFYKMETA